VKRAALALCLFLVLLAPIMPLSQSDLVLANAESSIPKPSVPEFTVKFADKSYDVPASTSIDPYTGQQIIHPSYKVENKTIDIIIKNQPFAAPNSSTNIYYNVRVKGHFEESWREIYYISNNTSGNSLQMQSASENTVISTPQDYPIGGKVDFQVEAVIATAHRFFDSSFGYWSYETSGWSNTQTITIDGSAPTTTPTTSPSQYPTATPDTQDDADQQGFNWTEISLFAALGVIVALLVIITLMHRRQTKK
jgi:hypothetical protein